MKSRYPAISSAGRTILDILLPPRCPSCRAIVAENGSFCAPCWNGLDFLTDPMCACCGLPFGYEVGGDALCAGCAARHPDFDSARAALVYNDAASVLILGLKYGDRTHLAALMARGMARAAADALSRGPLIVPVPLHPRRIRQRFFNQSALIARALGRLASADVMSGALERVRDTPPSRNMSHAARGRNVRGAIRIHPRAGKAVAGRCILLVDDVLTTGATAEACARALKRAGAQRVDVVTFARVFHHRW